MVSAALGGVIGIIPVTVASGVAISATKSAFGETGKPRRKSRKRKRSRSRKSTSFGNFSNVLPR